MIYRFLKIQYKNHQTENSFKIFQQRNLNFSEEGSRDTFFPKYLLTLKLKNTFQNNDDDGDGDDGKDECTC